MAHENYVSYLKHGYVKEWNDLREKNHDEKLDLTGADLKGVHLYGANLRRVNLRGANLKNTKIAYSDLRGANLEEANLTNSKWEKVDFGIAKMRQADLSEANMAGANLRNADLRGATIFKANLQNADLRAAKLQDAVLTSSDLRGATLNLADLQGANLRRTKGVVFSNNYVPNIRLDIRPRDPWSILRRNYTGPSLVFNLLLLITFFIPYILKVVILTSVNQMQSLAERLLIETKNVRESVGDIATCLKERAAALGLDAEVVCFEEMRKVSTVDEWAVTNVARCLNEQCNPIPSWQILINYNEGAILFALTVALITYNILKAALTFIIAPIREEEERSGYTPQWIRYFFPSHPKKRINRWVWRLTRKWQGYRPLFLMHKYFMRPMRIVAIFAFVVNGYLWLSPTVYVPG